MAPEVLDARVNLHDIQSFKQIDVYALAMIMWEVVWRCNVQEGMCTLKMMMMILKFKMFNVIEEDPSGYKMAFEDVVGVRPGIDRMRELVCTQKLRPQILTLWRNHAVSFDIL